MHKRTHKCTHARVPDVLLSVSNIAVMAIGVVSVVHCLYRKKAVAQSALKMAGGGVGRLGGHIKSKAALVHSIANKSTSKLLGTGGETTTKAARHTVTPVDHSEPGVELTTLAHIPGPRSRTAEAKREGATGVADVRVEIGLAGGKVEEGRGGQRKPSGIWGDVGL